MSDGTNKDITDENFFQDFQEFIDSTIKVNNLKESIFPSLDFNYFDSNGSTKTENSIFLNDSGSQIKRAFRHQNVNINRKKLSKKSISIKRTNNAKSFEILIEILGELVVNAIKKQYGLKIISTILKSKIVLSNKFIKHGLIQVAKKKIKKNIVSICKKFTVKKIISNKKFINYKSKRKLKQKISSKKFGSNTNIFIQNQSNKIKIPSIEDPILFIDDIYNQLFIKNFEIFNETETEISSSNDTIRMELDESLSNDLILEGRNVIDSIDELKLNNFDHAVNDFDFYPVRIESDDPKLIPDNLDRKKPILIKTDVLSNVNKCFSVLGSIKSLIVTKNLIIVPLILIFINSKYKFFSLNLSVSSSSITLFSAALSSWQLATPSTIKTSLAFTKTLKGLVNNFSK